LGGGTSAEWPRRFLPTVAPISTRLPDVNSYCARGILALSSCLWVQS